MGRLHQQNIRHRGLISAMFWHFISCAVLLFFSTLIFWFVRSSLRKGKNIFSRRFIRSQSSTYCILDFHRDFFTLGNPIRFLLPFFDGRHAVQSTLFVRRWQGSLGVCDLSYGEALNNGPLSTRPGSSGRPLRDDAPAVLSTAASRRGARVRIRPISDVGCAACAHHSISQNSANDT